MKSAGSGTLDMGEVNPGDWFDNVVIKVWIAKDSRLIMREDLSMDMNFTPENMGDMEGENGGITAAITAQMKFSDYNEPVTITLPPEAYSATETQL
jgi:hypothetical protein